MPKNKIGDLRNLLFETMERLMDDDDESMTVEKAKAVADVGKVIVESAKAETQFVHAVKNTSITSNFIDIPVEPKRLGASGDEIEMCKCGDPVYPSDLEKSTELGLNYPRCSGCLSLLPDKAKNLNGGGK